MNILIFNWRDIKSSWAGGGEIYVHELAKRWLKKGNTVTLFCANDPEKKLPKEEVIDGVRIVRKGGRFSVYFWAPFMYLTKLNKNTDFVVDIENGVPFFTPLFSLKKKIVLVYHVHGKQFFYELPFPLNIIGFLIEKFIFPVLYFNTEVMAISQSTKGKLMEIGFSKNKISIVEPGVMKASPTFLKKTAKYSHPTIIYLGRIKKYKRLDILVNAFPEIIKRIPKIRILLAGWGTEAPFISDLIMKNGFKRNIHILGPISEKEKRIFLRKSWMIVNPSLNEGWGISIIEANSYGTPAVAFKVPGLSDAIKNNKTGFLATSNEDFIDKIEQMLKNQKLRKKMEKESQRWADTLTWDKAAKNSLSIIKNNFLSS
jgi:glycosyltransferase involved in cell wall biosynthesis